LQVKKVISARLQRTCRRFLAQDAVANVLPLGDLYPPLLQVSDVYSAIQNGEVVGVCSIYRAYPIPSIVFGTARQEIKLALAEKAICDISEEFVSLCQPGDTEIFKQNVTVLHHHTEQQMIVNFPNETESADINVERVMKNELELLNKFYCEHGARAWVPLQFEVGPYYCVKYGGRIVSAAGVHLVAPQIAQLGNIFTDKNYRNRGFATACTSVLAADLASKGRTISLFVRKDNSSAIHIYKRLGFTKANDIVFLVMRKKNCCSVWKRTL